ncbi:putative high affinity sulfate transporter, sulfate permease family [Chlamydiales bacterium STE3]|nr:putative high affinity sulfate transporter, sulfate permease family [Chlamydiales bacterium STE3]
MTYEQTQKDEFSFTHFINEFKGYSLDSLRKDLFSGIQVSLLTIPQAMAYAIVAGLPLSAGLLAAIFSTLVAALVGSSRFLIAGPVNAIAILMQAGTAEILFAFYRETSGIEREVIALQIMSQIAFLAGLFQLLAAVFKLGRLTQFVSYSVVLGYLAGGALAIVVNQLFTFCGIPMEGGIRSLFERSVYFLTHLNQFQGQTLAFGLFSLITLVSLKRVKRKLPAAAITLILAIGVYAAFYFSSLHHWIQNVNIVGLSDEQFALLPSFVIPPINFGIINHLVSVAFAVALLSIIETTCTSKSIAATSGFPISINQEILAVGLANLTSSCTGAMPISVSNARSSLNLSSGARTKMAAIFNVLSVALIIHFFGFLVNFTPLPTLAALLFVTAASLVNYKQLLLCLKSTSSDALVLVATFLACIFFSLDTAFYIGVTISITLYLKKASLPQLIEYAIDQTGELKSLDLSAAYLQKPIRVIKVEGELFFGSADVFYTTLKSIAEDDQTTKVIILQLKNARDFDGTSCLALLQLQEYLEKGNRYLIACGMSSEVWEVMSNSGIIQRLKKENLFVFEDLRPQLYMQKALHRAKELLKFHEVVEESSDEITFQQVLEMIPNAPIRGQDSISSSSRQVP